MFATSSSCNGETQASHTLVLSGKHNFDVLCRLQTWRSGNRARHCMQPIHIRRCPLDGRSCVNGDTSVLLEEQNLPSPIWQFMSADCERRGTAVKHWLCGCNQGSHHMPQDRQIFMPIDAMDRITCCPSCSREAAVHARIVIAVMQQEALPLTNVAGLP